MTDDQAARKAVDDVREAASADLCERCYMTDAPQCGPPWCVNRNQGEGA